MHLAAIMYNAKGNAACSSKVSVTLCLCLSTRVSEVSENHGIEAMDNSRSYYDSTSINAQQKRTDIKGALL